MLNLAYILNKNQMITVKIEINGVDVTNRNNSSDTYLSQIQKNLKIVTERNKELFNRISASVTYHVTHTTGRYVSIISMVGEKLSHADNQLIQATFSSVYPRN